MGLGDFLTAVPAIRALRSRYSEAELTWVGKRVYGRLLDGVFDSHVEIASLDAGRPPLFDLAVNLHGSGPQSHELLGGSGEVVGFFHPRLAPTGPRWNPEMHIRQLWINMLASYSILGNADDFRLGDSDSTANSILLHIGARDRDRWWPEKRFVEVMEGLSQPVTVIAGVEDRLRAQRISERYLTPTLRQLVDLVRHAPLVIGVDSGVAHLAYAFGVPSVTLFGPAPVSRWGPPEDPRHSVLGNLKTLESIHPDGPCSPHLLAVTSSDVVKAANEVLSLSR